MPLLGIYSKELKRKCSNKNQYEIFHGSTILNIQKVQRTLISANQ